LAHFALSMLVWLTAEDPRVAIKIGNLEIRWYGLIIAFGALMAAVLASRLAKLKGINPDHIWQIFPWVLIGGIIGARLSFALVAPASQFPGGILQVLNPFDGGFAGLTIQGGLVGGFIAAAIYCRLNKLNLMSLGDAAIPGVALAQAIGRLGNFANQEAYGAPCTQGEWWCISIDERFRRAGYAEFSRFQPTFAYELVWNLLNAAILIWLIQPAQQKRFRLNNGDLAWIYLIFYSVGRYVIEGIRIDSQQIGSSKAPQVIAIISIVLAVVILILSHTVFQRRAKLAAAATGGDLTLDESKMVDTTETEAELEAQVNPDLADGLPAASTEEETQRSG